MLKYLKLVLFVSKKEENKWGCMQEGNFNVGQWNVAWVKRKWKPKETVLRKDGIARGIEKLLEIKCGVDMKKKKDGDS